MPASRSRSARATEPYSQVPHTSVVYCNNTLNMLNMDLQIFSNMMLENMDNPHLAVQRAISTISTTSTTNNTANANAEQPQTTNKTHALDHVAHATWSRAR